MCGTLLAMTTTFSLRDYQSACIEKIFDVFERGVNRPAVVLPTGSGKGHPLDTEIVTPDGLRLWGELALGDKVYSGMGATTEITGIYDRGTLPTYRVAFSDGTSVKVDLDHLWKVSDYNHRRTLQEWRTVSTGEILEYGLRNGRSYRWSIPVEPTFSLETYLPIGPYTLGALIANGYMGSSPVLSTPDEYVISRVMQEHSATRHIVDESEYCPRFSITGIASHVKDLGLNGIRSRDKFIPRMYLESGNSQRLALLNGLMDCDGSSREDRRAVNYHTTSKRLASDVQELVNSLGGTASISIADRIRPYDGFAYQEFTVHILMPSDMPAISTPRKIRSSTPRRTFKPHRKIVSIERVEDCKIRCITVKDESHLYQVTRNRIVTHNTVIFAHMCSRWAEAHPGRILILVHRDELVRQAVNKIRSVSPGMDVGVVKASENDVHAKVIVASVQTIARGTRLEAIEDVSLVIIDEAHHAAAPTYMRTMELLGSFAGLPTVGFTATMVRGDNKKLGDVWQEIVFTRDILWMIRNGYLVDVKGYSVEVEDLDMDDVKRSMGDYQEGALGLALLNSSAADNVADAYEEYTPGQSAILFAPTVQSADMFADRFNDRGIKTETVFGTTSVEDRIDIYRRAASGETKILANNMVLTEGFDMPRISAILNARPTQNVGLYIQMSGRALRPYPGKEYATLLDTTGVARQHSLRGLIDLATSRKAKPVEPGTPLSKAAALWDEEPSWDDSDTEATDLVLTEVDLFQRSHSLWLQTPSGLWFVPAGTHLYVLWPLKSGEYRVIKTNQDNARKAEKLSEDLPLDFAMSVAEGVLADEDPMYSSKAAKWRKGKAMATNAQISYALGLGIESPEIYTKSQLSDMISSAKAGRLLDPLFARRNGQ